MSKYIIIGTILFLLTGLVIYMSIFYHSDTEENFFAQIQESPCAKFEYCNDLPHPIYITSEIFMLSSIFPSLVLEESNYNVEPWVYKITFNCGELISNSKEIVVLVGEKCMSINGEIYSTPEEIPFKSVVDLFKSKYAYFSD